jgi:hypothetical protein
MARSAASVAAGVCAGVALVVSCADVDVTFGGSGGASGTTGAGMTTGSGNCACSIDGPITVDKVNNPVTVSFNGPVTVDKVNTPVAVQGIADPVKIVDPIKIAGPIDANIVGAKVTLDVTQAKFVAADTDINQIVSTSSQVFNQPKLMATGPFVITDFMVNNDAATMTIGVGNACPVATASVTLATGYTGNSFYREIHGARFGVPAGSVACVVGTNGPMVSVSGFKPY